MLVKNISFPSPLKYIEDLYDDNIDVFIDSQDGYTFTVSIATTKHLLQIMDQEKSNFSNPSELVIVVRKLTQEIITEALEAYAEDNAFWLKLHHFALDIDLDVFDKLQKSQDEEDEEFDKELSNL